MIQSYSPFLSTQSRRLIPKPNPNTHQQQPQQDKLSISSKMSFQDGCGLTLKAKNKKIIRNLEKQYQGIYQNREYLLSNIHQSQSKMNNFFMSKVPRFHQQSNQVEKNQSCSHFDSQIYDKKYGHQHPAKFVKSSSKVQSKPKFLRISTQKNVCSGRSQTNQQVQAKKKIPFSVLDNQNQGHPIPIKKADSHRIYELTDKKMYQLNADFFKNFRYRASFDKFKIKETRFIKSTYKSSKANSSEANKDKNQLSLNIGNQYSKKPSFIDYSPSNKKIRRNGGIWTSQNQRFFDIQTKKLDRQSHVKTGENLHFKKLKEKCYKYLEGQQKNLGAINKVTERSSMMRNRTLLKRHQNSPKLTAEQNKQKEEKIKAIIEKNKEYKSIGPGHYKNTHKSFQYINRRNGRNPAPEYQFFGSTKIRFQNSNNQAPRHHISTTDGKRYAREKKVKPQNGKLKAFGCTAENLKRTDQIKEIISTNRYPNESNPSEKFKPYNSKHDQ